MNKNVKRIFFVLAIFTLLVSIGAVSAADDTNSTIATDSSVSNSVTVSDTTSDTIAAEPATTTSNDNKVNTKTIEKEEKNLKTENEIVEVNNFNEFRTAIWAIDSKAVDEYTINFNEGDYTFTSEIDISSCKPKHITLNGNNQLLTSSTDFMMAKYLAIPYGANITINDLTENFTLYNNGNISFNNVKITKNIQNFENYMIYFDNSILNATLINDGNIIIADNVSFGDKFSLSGEGTYTINDSNRISPYLSTYNGDYTINNFIIQNSKTNNNNLTICNSTINSTITNNGNLTICDDVTFGTNCKLNGNGIIIINNTNRIYPYTNTFNGKHILNNITIDKAITNQGNLTITRSTQNSRIINNFNAIVIFKNSTLNNSINNNGLVIIDDDCIIGDNFQLSSGDVQTNNTDVINKLMSNGLYIVDYTITDQTINNTLTNKANLTIINSILNGFIINNANLIIKNSTINSRIINNGNLTITDDCTIGENCQIIGNGQLIMNDTTRVGIYQGNHIINNTILNKTINIPYDGNVTFTNSNIIEPISNNGNLTFINCLINAKITNYENLILENCSLSNNNMTTTNSKVDGFLLNNLGNTRLTGCTIENNTFNSTETWRSNNLCGAIVNNGFLNIENCSFYNNSVGYEIPDYDPSSYYLYGSNAGNGSCITNKERGILNINNTNFSSNYAGETGGVIMSFGNITIDYCQFINNSAVRQAEAIYVVNINTNNNITLKVNIYRSNFTDNYINRTIYLGQDSSIIGTILLQSRGNSIINNTLHISECNFKNSVYSNFNTIIEKSTFDQSRITVGYFTTTINITSNLSSNIFNSTDITAYGDINTHNNTLNKSFLYTHGNNNITNNLFTNNSGLNNQIIVSIVDNNPATLYNDITITNNTFKDNNYTANTISFTNAYSQYAKNYTIEENTYTKTGLNDTLDLNIPNKIFAGEPVTITGTYTINNPEYYDENILEQNKFELYINGKLTQTLDTLEFTITPTAGNMIITVQPSISSLRKTISLRSTTLSNITITPENYEEYIYEGALIGVGQNSKITFQGEFTDKGEIYIDTSDIIVDGSNATFTNTKLVLDAENIVLQKMNINNTDMNYPIANYKDNNIITNNTIILINTNDKATAIYNTASNTIIANNTLTVEGLAGGVDWDNPEGGVADTQAILLLGGNNNTIQNNTINIKSTQATGYNTLEAITNNNGATNTLITQNKINISGANFNYAIDSINNVENITITENTITATGERYCDGIQTGNNAKNILIDNNNITCVCINTTELTSEGAITYGVIGTMLGGNGATNITITNNNINLTGTANYGIELYWVDTTETHNNNITVNGPFSMGIGYAYSPNGNATQNNITINGDSTTPINTITEEFKPENVGIRVQNGTQNINIENNNITTSDVGGHDSTIHTEPDNVTIANNQLTSSQGYGDETIIAPATATIENNLVETTTTLAVPETIIINTPVELTATVTTADGTPINGGTITFTIGNEAIAQETVTNGIATATHTFTQEKDVTIVASYTPESTGLSTSSAEATTSIQAPVTQLNIEDVDLTAGETVTLTATVTDQNGNNLNGGKVTFKVNGKTIKDASGKVIYAKVVDGIATVDYTIPESLAAKEVNITAVYSGSAKYNKESTTITKTVITPEPTLTITPITDDVQTGSTITLKAKVAVGDQPITTGKIVFKINGKTVKDENGKVIYAKVDANGEVSIDYTLPESYKTGNYTVDATFIAPGYDKITTNTTMSVVKA